MKKKVTFEKKIDFPTMIGEISAISLEHNLKFVDESNIEGDFLLNGKYKLTEASRLEEDFRYKIPTEIALSEKIDLNTSNIEITDFTYDILNDDVMVCHIELLIEGLEMIEEDKEEEKVEEVRECDGDLVTEKEIEIPSLEKKVEGREEINEKIKVEEENVVEDVPLLEKIEEKKMDKTDSLFINLEDDNDTYGTFIVYIVRQNESINSIIEKYHTSLEEIEKYNDINDLSIGTKLIIPLLNE